MALLMGFKADYFYFYGLPKLCVYSRLDFIKNDGKIYFTPCWINLISIRENKGKFDCEFFEKFSEADEIISNCETELGNIGAYLSQICYYKPMASILITKYFGERCRLIASHISYKYGEIEKLIEELNQINNRSQHPNKINWSKPQAYTKFR